MIIHPIPVKVKCLPKKSLSFTKDCDIITKNTRIGGILLKLLYKTFLTAGAPSCHASTLCFVPGADGEPDRMLCAWFAGTRESADDVEIWLSSSCRGKDGAFAQWSEPAVMSRITDEACWNPVLYANGRDVTLFFKRGKQITAWKTFVRHSSDGGASFGPESELVPGDSGGRGPVKDKPVRLSDGTLLAGASHENPEGTVWRAFFDRSEDGGTSWTRTGYLELAGDGKTRLIQPSVWEDGDGVHALLRSDSGRIWRADSSDLGRSWGPAYPSEMPNNNSGIDCVSLADGRLVLVCNPVGSRSGGRTPLSLFVSESGGAEWKRELDLARGPGEYSYPAVISVRDRLYCSFTWRRQRICCCEIGI